MISSLSLIKSSEAKGTSSKNSRQDLGFGDKTIRLPSFQINTSSLLNLLAHRRAFPKTLSLESGFAFADALGATSGGIRFATGRAGERSDVKGKADMEDLAGGGEDSEKKK